MGYKVEHLQQDKLSHPTVLSGSAHVVKRYELRMPSAETPSFVYVKNYSDLKSIQEEVTFSALYRLDIGRHAAKSVALIDNENVVGLASYALPQFVDYHQLFSSKNKLLREKVFHCDGFGRPKSIRLTKGLAKILMSAWLYGEDDLHRRNIGIAIDEQGQAYWARLDFGMSFSSITQSTRPLRPDIGKYNAITLKGLQHFPDLGTYAPFYWPTSITYTNNAFNFRGKQKGNAYSVSDKTFFEGLEASEGTEASLTFQREKYDFLYQLFLVDIEEKKKLILANITDQKYANRLGSQIENRILTMRWTALCDPAFQHYVREMSVEKKVRIVADIESSHALLGLKTNHALIIERMDALRSKIDLVKRSPKPTTDLSDCIDQIFYLDIEIEALLSKEPIDTSLLESKKQALFTKQASLLTHYLEEREINEGLKQLNFVMYRRSALAPITQFIPRLSSHAQPYYYFRELRKKRIIPSLKQLDGMRSDVIYQHELPERLRHIETLVNGLIDNGDVEAINDILPNLDFRHENISIEIAIDEVRQVEQALLFYQFRQHLRPLSLRLSSLDKDDKDDVIALSAHYLSKMKEVCLNPYLEHCQSLRMSPAEIQKSQLLASCFQIQRLYAEILTDDLINESKSSHFVLRDLKRVREIVKKYQLDNDLSVAILNKSQLEGLTQAFQEIELVLTRLALDLQIEKMRHTDNLTPFMRDLMAGASQLSKAMSKPGYHDNYEMQAVSYAGYLGAKTLLNPTLENAKSCIDHARQISNSHQRRTKTKVAFALTLLGAAVVIGAIATLCWPAAIGVAVSLAAWSAFGTGSGLMLVSGNYGVRRFFRDQDKVKRKLEEVGESLRTHLCAPTTL